MMQSFELKQDLKSQPDDLSNFLKTLAVSPRLGLNMRRRRPAVGPALS